MSSGMTTSCQCVCVYLSVLSGESMHLQLLVCMCFVCEVAAVCVSGVMKLRVTGGGGLWLETEREYVARVLVNALCSKFVKSCHH